MAVEVCEMRTDAPLVLLASAPSSANASLSEDIETVTKPSINEEPFNEIHLS